MNHPFYSVLQIAQLLHIHPKTIQRYIREGKLRAVKIGKGWRISGNDLSAFTEENKLQKQWPKSPAPPERAKASAVVDIEVIGKDDAQRLIRSLNAAMNGKPLEFGQASLHTQYLETESSVRLSLWGNLAFTAAVLEIVNDYLQQLGEETP